MTSTCNNDGKYNFVSGKSTYLNIEQPKSHLPTYFSMSDSTPTSCISTFGIIRSSADGPDLPLVFRSGAGTGEIKYFEAPPL